MAQHTATEILRAMNGPQVVAQLALAATWNHLDDPDYSPVLAAAEVLELDVTDQRLPNVARFVRRAGRLDWTERVTMAIHLLLGLDSFGDTRQRVLQTAA